MTDDIDELVADMDKEVVQEKSARKSVIIIGIAALILLGVMFYII